jgi:cytochrome c-type biogenesis protein CcsB
MNQPLFNAALALYLLALGAFVTHFIAKRRSVEWTATALLVGGFVIQTIYIGMRWVEAGRAPFSNMFESLVLFAWTIVLSYALLRARMCIPWLGASSALLAAVMLAYASTYESDIKPLVPVLRSNWLGFHVMTCIIGYGALAKSFLASVGYLVAIKDVGFKWFWRIISMLTAAITFWVAWDDIPVAARHLFKLAERPEHFSTSVAFFLSILAIVLLEVGHLVAARNPAPPDATEKLNVVMSKTVSFGFFFLTLGILTGSVWANNSWGTYWSWDRKETWALITWFVYAIFLHCGFMRGWRGRVAAWVSIVGFLAVLFTFWGVNLLPGLHSYGSK